MRQTRSLGRLAGAAFSLMFVSAAFSPALCQSGSGAENFKSKCVLCHGADGSGNTPLGKQLRAADLRSKDVQKKTDAELHKVIHDGQTNMPGFADQLTEEEIGQLIKYVRSLGRTATK
ncbi:MAG: cytochrome c [Acidobacteria bacterium]|nr:cytochrome c [Acidobacteriota bacterium]